MRGSRLLRPIAPLYLAFACGLLAVQAQEASDDFNREDGPLDGDGWTVIGGDWNIVGEALRAGPAPGVEQDAFYGSPPTAFAAGDFVLEVDMDFCPDPAEFCTPDDFPNPGRHAGVSFCFQDPAGPRNRFAGSGYTLWWIDRNGDRGLNIYRSDNGAISDVSGDLNLPSDVEPPERIMIEAVGPRIDVFADDDLMISIEDDTYRGGYFGLSTWSGNSQAVQYDNFRLDTEVTPIVACCTSDPEGRVSTGEVVVLDASCSVGQVGELTAFEWDFGDGAVGTGEMVEHAYDVPDTYVITLTVSDDQGNDATTEKVMEVFDAAEFPFFDDFDRDDGPLDGDGWTVWDGGSGEWMIEDGRVVAVSGSEMTAFIGSPAQPFPESDFALSVDMEYLSPDGHPGVGRHAGIAFCFSEPTNRGLATGYHLVWIDRAGDRGLNIYRQDPGIVDISGDMNLPPDVEPPRTIRIEVDGPTIRVTSDNPAIPEIELDDDFYRGGFFGIWAYSGGQSFWFDNYCLDDDIDGCPIVVETVRPCFQVSDTSVAVGEDVEFDASCTTFPDGVTGTFSWDFGDGDTAEGELVTHSYAAPDTYVVVLTVTPSAGEAVTQESSVEVFEIVDTISFFDDFERDDGSLDGDGWTVWMGDWTIEDGRATAVTNGTEISAFIGSPPTRFPADDFTVAVDMEYLIPDGGPGVGRHAGIAFCFSEPTNRGLATGYHLVWIDRAGDRGLNLYRQDPGIVDISGDMNLPPEVEPPEHIRIEVDGTTITVLSDNPDIPELIVDDDLYRGGFFGMWGYSNGQQFAFDNYCLEEGPDGCEGPPVRPCFTLEPATARVGEPVILDASCTETSGGVTITAFNWDFGDGGTAAGEQVEHTYEQAGDYEVTLSVEHSAGAPVALTKSVSAVAALALPHFEDFEEQAGDVEGWTPMGGEWSVTDGALEVVTSGEEAHIWIGDPPVLVEGDISIEFDVEFLNDNPPDDPVGKHAGVFFYAQNTNQRQQNRVYDMWWIDRDQDFGLGAHCWGACDNGTLTFLSPGTGLDGPAAPPSVWRIEIEGSTIRGYGDGDLLVEVVNDQIRRGGYLGFWAWSDSQQVRFDNVCIARTGEPACEPEPIGVPFVRGDANSDGTINISDGVFILNYLFSGGEDPTCVEAADTNADGQENITDGVFLLNSLFGGAGELPPPGACADEPLGDPARCASFVPCAGG